MFDDSSPGNSASEKQAHGAAHVIEAHELYKVYGRGQSRVEALSGISLNVWSGEWISLIGPSGSGKSTLMNIIGLLDRPSSGSYALDGREVSGLKSRELSRARRSLVGFVFQSYNLLPRQSAQENVALPMIYADLGRKEREARAMEALEKVGLSSRSQHKPTELSGGQMQRVAIARALVNRPALVLADEPTGNLDSATGESILSLFSELHASGVTLMLVTHDQEVAGYGDRVVQIQDGWIQADNPSGRSFEHTRLQGSAEGPTEGKGDSDRGLA